MKLNFSKVCLFWGGMDAFYVIRFIWLNIEQGHIPFADDIINFNQVYSEYGGGGWIVLMFVLSMMLNISIVVSAILLIKRWGKIRFFVFLQIPFRLLLIVPSISVIPWLLKQSHVNSIVFIIILLVFSEFTKFLSFILTRNTKKKGGAHVE
ncbi:hypothetical protein AB3X28_25205 [Raoultella terrigena]|uniref:hypothetical protein n=1 Tax=Raoultella terrigena TaxID=577 RepID=UPI00349F5FB2